MKNNYSQRGKLTTGLRRWWLMLTATMLLILTVGTQSSNAQSITNYAFSASSGTFTPVSGGTSVPAILADDAASGALPIGFNFIYMGQAYTSLFASSNGILSFGAANASLGNNLSTGTGRPIIAPLWDDLAGTVGSATYITTGAPGNRVFTFEWLNWRYPLGSAVATISMQCNLYETDGKIEFIYRQEPNALGGAPSASVGLAGPLTGAGNFLSLDSVTTTPIVSSTVETTTINARPATGQIYSFTPPAAPASPTGLTFSAVTINSMTLDWTDATGEIGYIVERSLDGITYTAVATLPANTVSYVAGGLSASQTYYWNIRSFSEGQVSNPALNGNQATAAGTLCGTYIVPINYPTLTDALNAIRTNGLACSVEIWIDGNIYSSAFETFPIWIGGLGTLPGKTVKIFPIGLAPVNITSANPWATIVDSLAEYVTIDGRDFGVGPSLLTIQNTFNTGAAMRVVQESSNNNFQYINFRGQNNTTTGGVVFMGGSTVVGGSGNDNNLFNECDIHDNGALFPVNGFLSSANTTGSSNDNNTISNCRVYNFFSAGLATVGINLIGLNNNWTITGNRIYQDAARNYTTGNIHKGIVASNTLGTFNISNNIIGYATSAGTGTYTMAWATTAIANRFFGMDLNVAISPVSTISGNQVANINIATNSTGTGSGAPFCGIWLNAGGANITGNTVGSMTGTDNILVRGTATGGSATTANVIGIAQGAASATSTTISNNNIGGLGFIGITAAFANAPAIGATVCGIFNQGTTTLTAAGSNRTISGNTIGGNGIANSMRSGNALNAGFATTVNFSVIGILNTGSTRMNILNNTVQNLSVPTRSSAGVVYGIHTTTGINTISGNTVHTLTTNSKNVGGTTVAHLAGISHTSTTAPVAGTEVNIDQNTVRNLKINSDSSLVIVNGISFTGSTTTGFNYLIQRNNVYDIGDLTLTASDTAKVTYNGIGLYGGIASVQNNMISLGDGNTKSQIYQGILKANTNINRVYHNSVYIGGTASTASGVVSGSTWAFRRTARPTTGNDEIINNIFYNARTTAIGGAFEYATGLDSNINVTASKNILFADFANGGRTGIRNLTIATSMTDWRTLTGQDLNSISENPNFIAPAAGTPDLHLQVPPALVPAEQAGQLIASVVEDFDGDIRAAFTPNDIGADAGNFLPSGDYLNPTISSVTATPSTGQCTAVPHDVLAVVTDASGLSSVTLNWSLNGVAQTGIAMTNTSGDNWEAQLPASGNALVSYSVTAIDNSVNLNAETSASQSYRDDYLQAGLSAGVDQTICPGTSTNLSVASPFLNSIVFSEVSGFETGSTGAGVPAPGITGFDYIELTNIGNQPVDISGWRLELTGTTPGVYIIPAGNTVPAGGTFTIARGGGGAAIPGYYVNSTLLSVGSTTSQGFIISDLGGNISDVVAINGGTPFNPVGSGTPAVTASMWSGNVASGSGTAGIRRTAFSDSNTAADWTVASAGNLTNWGTFNVGLGTISVATISWSSGGTGSIENVTPLVSPTDYIVTIDDGTCTASDTVLVDWFTTLPAPIGYDSTHCGNQQALCDVSTVPGAVAYRWYTTPTGGTPIQNLPDTNLLQNVATTTTFYVAAFDGVCDGPRVAVTETVTAPDPVDIVATANDTICLGDVATLDATNSNPNYVFIWSGDGVGTLNVNNVQTVVSTPLAAGNYTFVVTATDAGAGCVTTDTLALVVNPNPNASANIDQTTICEGESVQLEVSGTLLATIGDNDVTSSTTAYPTAYGAFYWGYRHQMLIRASELTAAGFTAGPISSLAFDVTAAAGQDLTGFSIYMNHTTALDLSATQTTGAAVFGPVNYTSVVGVNTHTFTTPFVWNGVDNVVIETCFNNAGFTTNSTTKMDNTAYISSRWLNQDAAGVCAAAIASTASQRPQMILNGTSLPTGVTFSWAPATGLSATNIANPIATPLVNTTYVVTVTDPVTGCFTNDTVIINVLPVLPAPTTNNSAHCGNQIPTASVNAVPGATAYYWFDAASGGTILQADPSLTYLSSISTTTTLYVSAFDGSCLSPRTPVTITVAIPPAITAQASDSTLCAGTNTINLDEILGNYLTYTWTSDAGGNLNSTSGPSVTASPSLPGIYNYIVAGTDGVCSNTDTVTVEVFDLPTVNANIESAAFCEGGSVQLDVPSSATIGGNDVQSTTTGYPSAYGAFYWGYRMQNMILASELLAAGFSAGPINALGYNITTPAGQTLTGYTIKMANVVASDLNTEQTVSTVVYGPVNYNSIAGLNTHTFSTPFNWDGVSNVVIETCFNNASFTTNSAGNMDNTSFVSSRWLNQDAAGVCAAATGATASQRPQMILTRVLPGVSYSWSPAAGLSATNIPNPVASPLVSTNYVVTATDNVTGCTNTDTVFITVTPLPPAPTTNDPISRCGPGDVTATATAIGSGGLFWTGPNGGNILSLTGSLTQSVTSSGAFDVREFPANIDTSSVGFNPAANPGSIPVGYFPTTSQGMWFRVNNTGGTIIKSVDIYPNGPIGTPYGIAIIDSLGNTIGSVSGLTTVTAPNYETIELNIYVPYSTIPYAMRPTSSPNLSVHQDAIVQSTAPWQIAGEMNIIGYGNMPPLASYFGTTTFGYFYNWQVMHGCFGNEAVVNYTVNPAPTLAITPSGPTTFCGSGVVTLDAGVAPTDPGYVNFNWAPAAGLSATNVASVVATVSATTTYTVTADDGIPGGCINTATVTLTVNTEPFASVGIVPDTICTTSPFQFNGSGGSASFKYVGTTENLGQTAGWPFNGANASQRMQLYVSAAELNAAGLFGPSFINSVGFNVVAKLSSQPYTNFTVAIDEVVGGCFTSTTYQVIPGGNTVYTGNYSTVTGWNDIVFQTPYAWDGVSDIVVQTCFTNATNTLFDIVYASQTPGCTSTNALNAAACGAATGALTDFRPNMRFQGGSVNFNWSPATELSASNISNPLFTQSLGAGARQYVLTVTDPVSGCTATDTANFFVSPTPIAPSIAFAGVDTTICNSGTMSFTSVSVDGTLQWQSSTDGINFFDEIGANNPTFTSSVISSDTYYRLKAYCTDSSYSNIKYVQVFNPTITFSEGDTVCGQGTVTLNATANPGYFIRWYADSTSGSYLANGSPYNTFVTQTDTFWVAALVDTLVGSGGDTLTSTFAGGNGANGNFFDVNVNSPVTLTGMQINNNIAGAICEVWYRSGTHVGFEGSSAGWTQIFNGPVAAAQGYVTGLNLPLSNGITSFFVFLPGGGITYTNGVNLGGVVSSDANLAILEGYGTGGTFGAGLFGPPTGTRIWNGSLIYAVPNCVSARVPVIAVVNPAPAVTIDVTSATICENSSVAINVTGGTLDYTNFDWTPVTGLNVTTGTSVIATPLVTTTYTVTATGNIDGCQNSATSVITVNPAPVFTLSPSTQNLCNGDTANASVVVTAPTADTYLVTSVPYAPLTPAGSSGWGAGPSGDDSQAAATIPFGFTYFGVSYTNVNIYSNGFIQLGTSSNNTTTYGSVIPNAATPNNVIALAWEDLNVTSPDSIRYYTVGAAPNRRFVVEWVGVDFFFSGGNVSGQIVLNEGSNTIDIYHTNIDNLGNSTSCGIENGTGTYGLTPANRNFVVWTPNPVVNEAWRFTPVPAATIQWAGQGIIGSTTGTSIQAIPTTSGYYTCTVTNPLTGCTKVDSVAVNFNVNPTPYIVENDTTLCNPAEIYVHVDDNGAFMGGYPAGTQFTWSAIGVPIVDLDSISSTNGSSYSVIVTLPSGCSASSDTITVLTKSVAVVETTNNATCSGGGSISVTVTSGLPNYNYVWSTDLAQTNIVRNVTKADNQDTLDNLAAGTYYLQVYDEAGSPASCNSGVLTYVVGGAAPIVATVDSVKNISCNGLGDGYANVIWTGGVAPFSITWSDGNSANTTPHTTLAAGNYTVIVSDLSGCADTVAFAIVEPLPVSVTFTSTPESFPGALDGTVTAIPAGGTPGYTFQWADEFFAPVGTSNPQTGLPAGLYYGLVTDTNGCDNSATVLGDTIRVDVLSNATLNVKLIIEGYHDGFGGMVPALLNTGVGLSSTEVDTIVVELRDALSPTTVVQSATVVINTNDSAMITLPGSVIGNSYYIAVFHRNAVQTWSDLPVTFSGVTNYDFTTAATQAYFSNQIQLAPGVFGFYSGDVNQDEVIDIFDQIDLDNDIFNFNSGYVVTDLTGDGGVDVFDQIIMDNNIFNFIGSSHP